MKFCKHCYEYCELSARVCPACETPFQSEDPNLSNLKKKSYSGDIMGYVTFPAVKVQIDEYISQAGNRCARVQYMSDGIQLETIKEFFLMDKHWAMASFYSRMRSLGLSDIEIGEIPKVYNIKEYPLKIYKEGRYWKVKG